MDPGLKEFALQVWQNQGSIKDYNKVYDLYNDFNNPRRKMGLPKKWEYLLYLKAKTKSVAYDKLKIWADKDKKLPTKIECLTEANMLIKTLYFKDVKDFGGGIVRPAVIETDSPLYKGYKSVMIFAKVKKKNFKDEVFTLTFMSSLESLR